MLQTCTASIYTIYIILISQVRLKEKPAPDKVDLPSSIASSFDAFMASKSSDDFESFLLDFRTCTSLDSEQETYVANNIVTILKSTLSKPNIFPDSKHDEKLQESMEHPIFSLWKIFYQYEEKCRKCITNLLATVYNRIPCAGYLVLYFLKVHTKLQSRKNPNVVFKTNVYRILCESVDQSVESCLARDLTMLEKDSPQFFLWLLPDIYREFKNSMINNCDVLRTLVGCIDAKNLRDLIYCVTQGKLVIFKNDGVLDCVRDSLNYETFEQFCLWQLLQAHDVPIEFLQVSLFFFASSLLTLRTFLLPFMKQKIVCTENNDFIIFFQNYFLLDVCCLYKISFS